MCADIQIYVCRYVYADILMHIFVCKHLYADIFSDQGRHWCMKVVAEDNADWIYAQHNNE